MRLPVITKLVPSRETSSNTAIIPALRGLSWVQWAQFWSSWLAWTCDALDFFSVSLTVTSLASQFDRSTTAITSAITLTLLFRSVGAIIFGIISDRFGRKWPLVINLVLCAAFELGTSYCNTFPQFLATRSLFGIAMGGIWGLAASSALEVLPVAVRGLASGVLQQGYAVGYLVAAVINLTVVPHRGWRSLFWIGATISLGAAVIRGLLPESEVFLRARAARKVAEDSRAPGEAPPENRTRVFVRETRKMLKIHWKLCIYAVLLMTGFNFLSHGSQDLYPTYLETTKGFSAHDATIATIIGNCGAIAGGAIAGWGSQYIGRRLTIVICLLLVGAFIPLWILPSTFSPLAAGAFCLQVGVQGAWGVVPIQLAEMSPPAFRATFPGVAYQLGNMVSAASAQIESTAGSHLKTWITVDGQRRQVNDYATVQGIFIGVIVGYLLIVTIVGPEHHSAHFEKHKAAFEVGGGQDDAYIGDAEGIEDGEGAASTREDDYKGRP